MTAEEEVQSGILNALERGVPMEKAVQSFLNAGYPESAVRSAARAISEKNVSSTQSDNVAPLYSPTKEIAPVPVNTLIKQEKIEEKSEGVSKTKIIILSAVLIILLAVLVSSFLFKEQLISLFS